jgi:putative Mg2+ transporter-C (MgtC) family protein
MEAWFTSHEINTGTAIVRLIISFLLSAVIGLERQFHNQPAGLRTHILISIGATIVMLLSIYIPQTFTNFQNGDPGRIAAQVVSGIGFLGAGAIMRFGGNVRGLTTAASIWAMAAIGLAIGAGMFLISVIGVIFILLALSLLEIFEMHYLTERLLKKIELVVKKRNLNIERMREQLQAMKIKVTSVGFDCSASESTTRIVFHAMIPANFNLQLLLNCYEEMEGVVSVSIESVN